MQMDLIQSFINIPEILSKLIEFKVNSNVFKCMFDYKFVKLILTCLIVVG